jgi:hypothetical protein
MYKQNLNILTNTIGSIQRIADNSSIPLDPDNTDYQNFKKDLADGVSCKDAEGNDMTADQITEFLNTLL